jgi:hypothetical protein
VGGRSRRVMFRDALFFFLVAGQMQRVSCLHSQLAVGRRSAGRGGDDRAGDRARGGLTRSRLLDIGGLSMLLTLD